MFKHLLVPTDGSGLSEAAILMAVGLARETQAKVTGVHVLPEFHVLAYGTEMLVDTEERFIRGAQQHADEYLNAIVKAAGESGVECDTVATTRTHPYEGIIWAAKQRGCDLIVMASHGRSGVRAVLLGSETQKVLTHSAIPVLVVRQLTQTGIGREAESSKSSTASRASLPQTFIVAQAELAVIPVRVQPS